MTRGLVQRNCIVQGLRQDFDLEILVDDDPIVEVADHTFGTWQPFHLRMPSVGPFAMLFFMTRLAGLATDIFGTNKKLLPGFDS